MLHPGHPTIEAPPPTAGGGSSGELLTDEQVADELGVSPRRVQGWISRGLLRGTHPARGVWRIRRADLDAWLDAGRPVRAEGPRARRRPVPERIDPATLRVAPISRRNARLTAR